MAIKGETVIGKSTYHHFALNDFSRQFKKVFFRTDMHFVIFLPHVKVDCMLLIIMFLTF